MAITWQNVINIAAALEGIAVGARDQILEMVDRQIDDTTWGSTADDGRTYLAAHIGTLVNRSGGASGSVVSESLGPMSRAYAAAAGSDSIPADLASTSYGVIFYGLVRQLPTFLGMVP